MFKELEYCHSNCLNIAMTATSPARLPDDPHPSAHPKPPHAAARGLGQRFLTIWLGQTVSQIGSALSGIAVAVYVYLETGNTVWLGVLTAITGLPMLLVATVGSFIDRHTRRSMMIGGDLVAAVFPAAALVLALMGRLEIWHLAVAGFVSNLGSAAQTAADQAAVPALVEASNLERAHSLKQLAGAAGIVIGPLLATPILVHWGIAAVLAIDLATFAIGVLAVVAVPFDDPPPTADVGDDGSWRDMWRWLRSHPAVLGLLGLSGVLNLTVAFFTIGLFVIVTEVAGAESLGLVLGIGGAAMVAGSIAAAALPPARDRIARMAGALVVVGSGFVIAGLRPSLWAPILGVVAAFAMVPVVSAIAAAIFNQQVPTQMQGRVFALRTSLSHGLQALGSLVAGVVIAEVADPLMSTTAMTESVGRIIGTGPSRGAGLVLIAAGLATAATAALLSRSRLRHA